VTSRRRLRARPWTLIAIDAVVAVVAIAVSWALLSSDSVNWPVDSRAPDGFAYALVVAVNAPIAFRRQTWGAALAIALCAGTVYAARQYPPIPSPAVPLIVYLAATRLAVRRSLLVLIVAVVISWIGATLAAGATDPQSALIVAGTWLLGHYVRTRRLLVAELQQRATDLEREREERAARAVAEERLRIARDLHDVLAHTMSVVAVQAGTGRLVGPNQPGEAIKALTAVEETARSAMHEMRQILTVLRTNDDTGATVTPTPSLDDLAALVAQVTEAGIAVEVRVEGEPRPISTSVGLAAYRIIQEALTNVIKHAGPANASVLVRYTDDDVTLEICDNGRATASTAGGGGHGLVGMRERAAVHGGELIAGPVPNGGFRVRARLPLGAVEP
jgi:signal transduction histidine kinase